MESFDKFAHDYDDLLRDPLRDRFADGGDFFIQQKVRVVQRRLNRRRAGRPLRVLDAGCGQGRAFTFFDRETHVFGSDISLPMLREAVARGPVTVQEPLALPFADGTFDAVFAFCIYHHIPDEFHVQHLRELRRVTSADGEVMVFEHNPYNPVTRRIFERAPVDQGCHMIPPPALRQKFAAAGLVDLVQEFILFVPQPLHRWLGFVEPGLAWLPLGGQYFVSGRRSASS